MLYRTALPALVWLNFASVLLPVTTTAQTANNSASTPAEGVAERYMMLLRRSPRYGTAFDRVVEFEQVRGTLPSLISNLQLEFDATRDGNIALLIGMLQSRQSDDTAAISALQKAEVLLPEQPLASFYLGKSLASNKQWDAAIGAMRRALDKKPSRQDLLTISMELGRLFHNARRDDEALQTWEQLAKDFPGDVQVLRQIAVMQADSGQWEPALQTYAQLAASSRDPFQQVEYAIRVAELKVKLGKQMEALAEFEALLPKVDPESWLHELIRNQIDGIYLESADYDGLIQYYAQWIAKHPEDVDSMIRCGRLLSIHNKLDEAESWFRKATERVPRDPGPKLALADALERDDRIAAATQVMQELVQLDESNPDYIVRWGQLVFANRELPLDVRARQASDIWHRLLDTHGSDAVMVTRVADLLRSAGLSDKAILQYKSAIELAQMEPQYREYLGEYLHQLGRADEALVVWRQIASGPRESLDSLVRLSEVLATFGYLDEALLAMDRACEQKPAFRHRMRYAKLLRDAERNEDSLAQVALAAQMVESEDEREQVWSEEIENYLAADQLQHQIAIAEQQIARTGGKDVLQWQRLALLMSAARQGLSACDAIEQARQLAPDSIPVLQMSIRLNTESGNMGVALQGLQRLSTLDRPSRSSYTMQIATLQLRLGMVDEALATARELINTASASTEQFRYFADLCYQAGQPEQAIEVLRDSLLANPKDEEARLLLARGLANQFESDEAIGLGWTAFERSKNMEDREQVLQLLTELYLRSDNLDELLERLELFGRERNRKVEATLLQASVSEQAGYLLEARDLLERALVYGKNEERILERLKVLATADDDFDAAAKYQQRINQLSPSNEGQYALARIYVQQGEMDLARRVWQGLNNQHKTSEELSKQLLSLLARGEFMSAASVAQEGVSQFPDNWEIAAYAVLAFRAANDLQRASEVAGAILAMDHSFDLATTFQPSQATAQSASNPRTRTAWYYRANQFAMRFNTSSSELAISRMPLPNVECFGDARTIAILQTDSQKNSTAFKQRLDQAGAAKNRDALWELLLPTVAIPNQAISYGGTITSAHLLLSLGRVVYSQGNGNFAADAQQVLLALDDLDDPEAAELFLKQMQSVRQRELFRLSQQLTRPTSQLLPQLVIQPMDAELLSRVRALALRSNSIVHMLFVYQELARADRDEEASGMLQLLRGAEGTPTSLAAAALELASTQPTVGFDLMLRAMDEAGNTAYGLVSINPYVLQFVPLITQDASDPSNAAKLLSGALIVHASHVRSLRPSQLAEAVSPVRAISVVLTSGGVATRIQTAAIPFPSPSAILSPELLQILDSLHKCHDRDVRSEVIARLNDHIEQKQDPWLRTMGLVCRATWNWWDFEWDLALEDISSALEVGVGGGAINFLACQMFTEAGDFSAALEHLGAMRPTNPTVVQQRAMGILNLSLKLGETDRAESAARMLFAMELDPDTQLKLAQTMADMGMKEMADNIMTRLQLQNANSTNMQAELLKHYQSSGDEAAALAIAKSIVRRTRPIPPPPSSASRTITSQRAKAVESERSVALDYLRQQKQLDEVIQDMLKRLEAAPESKRLKEQLAELYTVNGDRAAAASYSTQPAQLNANTPFSPTINPAASKQDVEAYLKEIKQNPQLVSQLPRMFSAIDRTSSWKMFAETVDMDANIQIPAVYMTFLMRGLAKENAPELAVKMLKKSLSDNGLNALTVADALGVSWSNPRNSKADSFLAHDEQLATILVDQILNCCTITPVPIAYGSQRIEAGRLQGTLATVLAVLRNHEFEMQRLFTTLLAIPSEKRTPTVNLFLTILYADANRINEAAAAFESATSTKAAIVSLGFNAVWEVGSILALDHQQYDIVAHALVAACAADPNIAANVWGMFPLLTKCCQEIGKPRQVELAIDHLMNATRSVPAYTVSSSSETHIYQSCIRLWQMAQAYSDCGAISKALQAYVQAEREFEKFSSNSSLRRVAEQTRKQVSFNVTSVQLAEMFTEALASQPEKLAEFLALAKLEIWPGVDDSLSGISCTLADILKRWPLAATDYATLMPVFDSLENLSDDSLVALSCFASQADDFAMFNNLNSELLRRVHAASSTMTPESEVEIDRHSQRHLSLIWMADQLALEPTYAARKLELLRTALRYPQSDFSRPLRSAIQSRIVQVIDGQRGLEAAESILRDLLRDLPRDTFPRYEMAWRIAEVSVKDGLHQLSMDAAVIALENGPPIKPISIPPGENSAAAILQALRLRNSNAIRTSSPPSQSKIRTASSETKVALGIEELSKEWRASGATEKQLTDALFQIVFPSQRQSGFYCYSTAEDTSGKLVFDNMASATSAKLTHYSAVGELLRTSYSAGSISAVLDAATRRSQGSVTRESKTMQMRIAAHLLAGESDEARGLWNVLFASSQKRIHSNLDILLNIAFFDPNSKVIDWFTTEDLLLIPSRELAESTQLQWLFMLGARKAIEAKNAESLRQIIDRIIEVFAYRSSNQQARLTSLYTAIVEIAQACDSSEIATLYRGKMAELHEGN